MSLDEMQKSDSPYVSIRDAAEVLGCNPQRLRDMLDIDDERPREMRRFLFPHCKVGNRRRIMREGFLKWIDGTMMKEEFLMRINGMMMKEKLSGMSEMIGGEERGSATEGS